MENVSNKGKYSREQRSIVHRYYLFVSASEGFMFTEINRKILLGILFVTNSSKEEIRKERRF